MKSKKMLEHIQNYDDLSFTGPIGPFDPNENFSKKHNFLYLLTPLIVQNSLEHIQSWACIIYRPIFPPQEFSSKKP